MSELITFPRPEPLIFSDILDFEEEAKIIKEFKGFNLTKCVGYSDPHFEFQKYTCNDRSLFPPTIRAVIEELQSEKTVKSLESLSGLSNLKIDDGLWGGGMHITLPHGYLASHKDFNVLPTTFNKQKQFRRVLNLIGYFSPAVIQINNSDYKMASNNWILFNPSDLVHGHPIPHATGFSRYSIAVYYYQECEVPKEEWRSTQYFKLPWMDDTQESAARRLERADVNIRYKSFLEGIKDNPVIKLACEMADRVESEM